VLPCTFQSDKGNSGPHAYPNLTNLVQGSKLKEQAWNIHLCVVWSKMNIPGSGRFFQMIAVDNTARLMTESGMPRGGNDQFLASLCCQLARFRSFVTKVLTATSYKLCFWMSTRIEASCQKIGESGLNNWSSDIGIQKLVHLWARSRLQEMGVKEVSWEWVICA